MWPLLLLILALPFLAARAQSSSDRHADTATTAGVLFASIPPVVVVGGAIYQNYATFWKNDGHVSFHFSSDPPYSLHNDKFGHAYFTTFAADLIAQGYETAKLDTDRSLLLGCGAAFLGQLLVEIEDGFHTGTDYYGFSPGDAAADIAGALLPLGSRHVAFLRAVGFKASFWPSEALKRGAYRTILDDDESHYYWLTFNLHDLLHSEVLPAWLSPAVGYSVEDLESARPFFPDVSDYRPRSRFFFALDLDLSRIPLHNPTWDFITGLLRHVRLPLPAYQLAPTGRWYWFR